MRPENRFLLIIFLLGMIACGKKTIPENPMPANNSIVIDSLPLSDIDIPIRINLKPIFAIAESNVQQVYTTPGYPNDFVVENCDTRYMYRFRRSPLQFTGSGDQLGFGFTGYYIMAGGQRICTGSGSNRTAVSPWSPTCTCGLTEGERKVSVNFQAGLTLKGDYHVVPVIKALEPKPIDKCTVCFWGQDITPTVMERLKAQLDEASVSMTASISALDLRPQFQKVWDVLNTIQPISNYGYLQINPQQIRVSNLVADKDTLRLSIGISARPRVVQVRPAELRTVIPDISIGPSRKGFSIHTDAIMHYDSLSNILNAAMYKKRIEADGRYLIVEKVQVYGSGSSVLNLKMVFSGSASGTFYLSGKPVYDATKKELRLEELNYDIRSKDVALKAGEWLFNKKITRELEKYTRFDVSSYEQMLLTKINSEFNREIRKGISIKGLVKTVNIEKIYPFIDQLVVRFGSTGDMEILVNEISF